MESKNNAIDLKKALLLCKSAFIATAVFSLAINLLQLVPTIYMLQLYDRVVPTGNKSTLLMLTLLVMVLFLTTGILEWVRSQILVRVSVKLEVLLNERLFGIAYKQSLYASGKRESSQHLDDLTSLRQFMTGNALFAFFDAPWLPLYVGVMFMFHAWYGWAAVFTSILLITIAVVQERSTASLLRDANALSTSGRNQINKNLRNSEVIHAMGMLSRIQQQWLDGSQKTIILQTTASQRAGLFGAISKLVRISSQSLILCTSESLFLGR